MKGYWKVLFQTFIYNNFFLNQNNKGRGGSFYQIIQITEHSVLFTNLGNALMDHKLYGI